ncbi:unnamed protein product [Candidula unifasciata]|uniref:NXPE C-terminal domain-containing protein n=1 Tax=Candidula unifasciata TaxID=100452 RepID=A0A8S3Z775_9EUPU|nr:unnamed protein product [Candidula unifasciata]
MEDLVPTSKCIDAISSRGHYLIILNHYYHLTPFHIIRLFKRNPNVQVVLQGPHIAWNGWKDHYVAGDMLATAILDLQQEIFHDVKDKVMFISPWDMTVATENLDYHPSTNDNIFDMICGFMCGR